LDRVLEASIAANFSSSDYRNNNTPKDFEFDTKDLSARLSNENISERNLTICDSHSVANYAILDETKDHHDSIDIMQNIDVIPIQHNDSNGLVKSAPTEDCKFEELVTPPWHYSTSKKASTNISNHPLSRFSINSSSHNLPLIDTPDDINTRFPVDISAASNTNNCDLNQTYRKYDPPHEGNDIEDNHGMELTMHLPNQRDNLSASLMSELLRSQDDENLLSYINRAYGVSTTT